MGLLDIFTQQGANVDPRTMGLLGALGAYGQTMAPRQASRMPFERQNPLYPLMMGLGGYGQGYGYGIEAQGQQTRNKLQDLNLRGYEDMARLVQQGDANSAAPGRTAVLSNAMGAGWGAPEGGLFPDQNSQQFGHGADYSAGRGQQPGAQLPAGTQIAPGAPRPLFNVANLRSQLAIAMRTPSMAGQAAQIYAMITKGAPEGSYLAEDGLTVVTRPGMLEHETNTAYGKSFGTQRPQTEFNLAEDANKIRDVAPRAQLVRMNNVQMPSFQPPFAGPMTPQAQPRQSGQMTPQTLYTNPNDAAQVAINLGGEDEFVKKTAGALAEQANELTAGMSRAQRQVASLTRARQLVEQWRVVGGTQGMTAPMQAQLTSFVQSIGMDPAKFNLAVTAGPAEALNALSNQLALGYIGTGGLPADNFSEADRNFVKSIPGDLGDTAEGFEAKVAVAERVEQRNIEKAMAWLRYPDRTKAGFEKFLQEWQGYVDKTDLFSKDEQAEILAKLKGRAAGWIEPNEADISNTLMQNPGVTREQLMDRIKRERERAGNVPR